MKKLFISLALLTAFAVSVFAQNESSVSTNTEESRAAEIVAQYFKATGLKKDAASQQKLSLSLERTWQVNQTDISEIEEYYLSGNLLRLNTKNPERNNFSRSAVLNGDKYFRDYFSTDPNHPSTSRRNTLTKERQSSDSEIKYFKWSVFRALFPITLEASWYAPIQLRFVGVAESKTGKADVLEAKLGKSTTFQLLFDKDSHLLTVWKITITDQEGKSRNTIYYFDDYKDFSGIKVAAKIEINQNNETDERVVVKSFDPNPTFPADFFVLK